MIKTCMTSVFSLCNWTEAQWSCSLNIFHFHSFSIQACLKASMFRSLPVLLNCIGSYTESLFSSLQRGLWHLSRVTWYQLLMDSVKPCLMWMCARDHMQQGKTSLGVVLIQNRLWSCRCLEANSHASGIWWWWTDSSLPFSESFSLTSISASAPMICATLARSSFGSSALFKWSCQVWWGCPRWRRTA